MKIRIFLYLVVAVLAISYFPAANASDFSETKGACAAAFEYKSRSEWYTCVTDLAGLPVFLSGLGPASASGYGIGVRGTKTFDAHTDVSGSGLVAADGSYRVQAQYDWKMHDPFGENEAWDWQLFGSRFDLRKVPFYGLGAASSPSNLSYYRESNNEAGGLVSAPLRSWLDASGQIRYSTVNIGAPAGSAGPSALNLYQTGQVPGLAHQSPYLNFRVVVTLHDKNTEPREKCGFGFRYQRESPTSENLCVSYDYFHSTESGSADFHRVEIYGTFAYDLRASTSATHSTWGANLLCQSIDGSTCSIGTLVFNVLATSSFGAGSGGIPFYFDKTLGGTDIDGVDTLRGFDTFRFQASNRELIQAEFYKAVWGPIGVYAFYDAGKVEALASRLGLSGLQHDVGSGIYIGFAGNILIRAYVAGGGGDGTHFNLRFASAL